MSTALCPPHKTVHSAIIRISSRSCRPALPVRGSSSPSKQAMNPSISRLPPTASKTPWIDSIASQHASLNALVKLFQMQFPCAGDAFVVIDGSFNIILFNRAAERVFQYEAAEIIGQSVHMLLPERFRHGHGKQMTEFRDHDFGSRLMGERRQIRGLRRDGTEFPAEASIAWVSLGGPGAYVVVLRD